MRSIPIILGILLLAGGPATAQERPQRPSADDQAELDGWDRPGRPPGASAGAGPGLWRDRPGRGMGEYPSDEQWEQALAFFTAHAPHRTALMLERERPQTRPMIWGMYQRMRALEDEDPPLHQVLLRKIELEDEEFGLSRELRGSDSEQERLRLREQIHETAAEIVQIQLEERALRLDRMEQALQAEREKLAADRQRVEELVERRISRGGGPGEMGPRRFRGPDQDPDHPPDE